MADAGSVPMSDPLAYFLTWTTSGTWLRGDARGWVDQKGNVQAPDWKREHEDRRKLVEAPCFLTQEHRTVEEDTIRRHCEIRGWELLAVACRSNHVHVVIAAAVSPSVVMDQLKAWSTRRLKEYNTRYQLAGRNHWWTDGGSKRYLNDEAALDNAITYVLEGQ